MRKHPRQAPSDLLGVGLTYITGVVTGPSGEAVPVEFLIDTGAQYSLLPNEVWQRLGLAPKRTMAFHLADGTRIERAISECHIRLSDEAEGHTTVILGQPGDVALLGVYTLEGLALVFNPFDRSLRPMTAAPLMLLSAYGSGAPARNQRAIRSRSASVIPVWFPRGMTRVTMTCS